MAIPRLLIALSFCPLLAVAQFSAPQPFLQNDAADPLQAIDLDNDGDRDLVRFDAALGIVAYENFDGLGSFSFGGSLIGLDEPIGLWTLGDTDGDGLPDLLVELGDTQELHRVRNLGAGQFASPVLALTAPAALMALTLAELSGDSVLDLVFSVGIPGESASLHWALNTDGVFGQATPIGMAVSEGLAPFIRQGDLDESGGIDLLTMDGAYNVLVYRNIAGDGTEWMVETVYNAAAAPLSDPQLLDIDGDGDLDLGEAAFPDVQWIENTLQEGGVLGIWKPHSLEPWTSAGPGAFGQLGCGAGAGLVVFPLNPSAGVRYAHWLDAVGAIPFANGMPDVPRGSAPLLADLDGDGRDDLVLYVDGERLILLNVLQPATTEVILPELPTLCKYGPPLPLPEAAPAGGQWMGQHVIANEYFRSFVVGSGMQTIAHAVYETQGCPAGASAEFLVVEQPIISPAVSGVLCAGDGPIQLTSVPPATEWIGCGPDGVIDPAIFTQGVVVALYIDATGELCATETDPLVVWPSMPAQINPAGPFCVNSGTQLITSSGTPGAEHLWSGAIDGFNSAGASFLPSQGAGTYAVILTVEPMQPGQCEGVDTLLITVSDAFPEVELASVPLLCITSDPVDLLLLATPAGGTWSGPGISEGIVSPSVLGAGSHFLTYTYFAPEGCATSEALGIDVVAEAQVSVDAADLIFCTSDEPAQFTGLPEGGAWSTPIDGNGLLDPLNIAPGDYPVLYTWTGADGCTVVNATNTLYVLVTSTPVIDEVGVLCDDDAPIQLTGAPSGIWGGSISGSGASAWLDPVALGAGTWPVTLTAANDGECAGTTTVEVLIEVCTNVADAEATGFRAWPNPFSDHLTIETGTLPLTGLDVLDATGRLILHFGPLAGGSRRTLDLQGVPQGAYLLRSTGADGSTGLLRVLKH
ncbi:MAG: T9SS type A sorting domain-containing protein [Flavobacteriales bacterium]|nr:T9SS type A sorting domain-containing protein [Flavobacteriales bacterium]